MGYFDNGLGKGYAGKSMSVNACEAYSGGEMPLSKWRKSEIVQAIEMLVDEHELELDLALLKKMSIEDMRRYFLEPTIAHHTSALHNSTLFYSLDEDFIVKNLNNGYILWLIEKHKKELAETKAKRTAEKAAAEARRQERARKEEILELFKYQNKYKSKGGFLKNATPEMVEALKKERAARIAKRREELRKQWVAQKFEFGLEKIDQDDFVEKYM